MTSSPLFFRIAFAATMLASLPCVADDGPMFQGKNSEAWITQLKSPEPGVRLEAAKALAHKDAVPVLIAALKSDTVEVRAQAAQCLSRIGPDARDAAPALIAVLKTKTGNDLGEAAKTLAFMGPEVLPQIIALLREVLDDPVYRKVKRAVAADPTVLDDSGRWQEIGGGSPEYIASMNRVSNVIAVVGLQAGRKSDAKAAIPLLIEAARWDRAGVGANARSALSQIGDDAVQPLLDALHDCPPFVFDNLINALGQVSWSAKSAVPALVKLQQAKDDRSRLIGASGLAACVNSARLQMIGQTQRDSKDLVEAGVVRLMAVELANPKVEMRRAAARTLSGLQHQSAGALPELLQASADADGQVRQQTALALQHLVRVPEARDRIVAAMLRRLKDPEPIPLQAAINTLAYAVGLAGASAPEAIPDLLPLLSADHPFVRSSACVALSVLLPENNPRRGEIVQTFLTRIQGTKNHQDRIVAVESLMVMRTSAEPALPVLLKLAEGEDQFLTPRAIAALGSIVMEKSAHAGDVVAMLQKQAQNKNANIGNAATTALKELQVRQPQLVPANLSPKPEPPLTSRGVEGLKTVAPVQLLSAGGATLKKQEDDSVLASGTNPANDTYVITAESDLRKIAGLRLEVLKHDSLPGSGPGRLFNGTFILTRVEIAATSKDGGESQPVALKNAVADFTQQGHSVQNFIDGKPGPGWAIWNNGTENRHVDFQFEKPLAFESGAKLSITLKHGSGWADGNLGRFRISAIASFHDGIDPRTVVTKADVEAVMGRAVDAPTMQGQTTCIYRTLPQHYNVEFGIVRSFDRAAFLRLRESGSRAVGFQDVAGIGDEAFWVPGNDRLSVRTGEFQLHITTILPVKEQTKAGQDAARVQRLEAAKTLARKAVERMVKSPEAEARSILPSDRAAIEYWVRQIFEAQSKDNVDEVEREIAPKAIATLPTLMAMLKENDRSPRITALMVLSAIGPEAKEAAPLIRPRLPGNELAAVALARVTGDVQTVMPMLLAAVKGTELESRKASVWALGAIGPDAKEALPVLIELLKSDDRDLRWYAVVALG